MTCLGPKLIVLVPLRKNLDSTAVLRIHYDHATVYHFDIPVDDANRDQQFYKDVFGWDMKKITSRVDPNIELWMCETEDENGRKGITGGMMKRDKLPAVTNYISVNSIDEYIPKINKSGGRVTVPRTEIPNVGYFAMFLDSENNLFGLFQKRR